MNVYYGSSKYRYDSKIAKGEDFRTVDQARAFDLEYAKSALARLDEALAQGDEEVRLALRFLAEEIPDIERPA